jgi:hypothetical protein
MLEAIQILIDRMEMFPDDFRQNGNLNDFLYILDDIESRIGTANYYKSILTEEEINAFREAALKFHRENFNRKVLEAVMQGHSTQRENKLLKEMRSFTQKSGLYGEVAVGGAGGGGTGVIGGTKLGGGAFVTKTGALFTPANIPKKKKK